MTLTFELLVSPPIPLEPHGVLPETVHCRSLGEIQRWPILHGNTPAELGEWFRITGDPASARHAWVGDLRQVDGIAAGLSRGEVLIDGAAGDLVAAEMTGGMVEVRGDVGLEAATNLRGGVLRISGSAGDHLGGSGGLESGGMRGGEVHVAGDVGKGCGERMSRGLITVRGRCGDFPAWRMRAGTLVVAGPLGEHAGLEMRRGTLVTLTNLNGPATYRHSCIASGDFTLLRLLGQRLVEFGGWKGVEWPRHWRLFGADPLDGGRGEIFVAATPSRPHH